MRAADKATELPVAIASLRKTFGATVALAGLTCGLAAGEIVGLLGPNGAGKTTAMKLLLGLLRPTAGTARIEGLDCTADAREVKRRLGYCPDEPSFYDFLTGRETVDFVLNVRGEDRAAAWERLDPIVLSLDFEGQLD